MTPADIIQTLQDTGTDYARAVEAESLALIAHSALKAQLIDSIIGTDNPLTGKPHSASSADTAASASDEYRASQRQQVAVTKERMLAEARYAVVKAVVRLRETPDA